jgi:hypothetical protein
MHSISTRATTHGRRRNLTRAGGVALAAAMTSGIGAMSAFAATATPAISIQPPSESATVGGAPIIVKVGVLNNDARSVSLTSLGLALACTPAGVPAGPPAPGALATLCGAGDEGVFQLNGITIDPANTGCSGLPFTQAFRQDTNSNVLVSNINFTIQPGQGCLLDVSLSALSLPPAGDSVYFLAGAAVDDGTGPATGIATDEPVLTVLAANPVTPPVTPPVVHHEDHDGRDRDFRDERRHDRRDVPRCNRFTPNNGNGNVGFGNNGNGNVGNCNNGNGNQGDNSNGNGNGFDSPGDE